MVYFHEMGDSFINRDAKGNSTIRLARKNDIFTLKVSGINERGSALRAAGFDLVKENGGQIVLGVPYLFDAHMHFRDPSGLLPIIGKTSSRLLT